MATYGILQIRLCLPPQRSLPGCARTSQYVVYLKLCHRIYVDPGGHTPYHTKASHLSALGDRGLSAVAVISAFSKSNLTVSSYRETGPYILRYQ